MKLWIQSIQSIYKSNRRFFSIISYLFLTSALFVSFFYSLSKTDSVTLVPSCNFDECLENEETANVGTFVTDNSDTNNDEIINYFENLFSARNNSFLTGNVENLYTFYDTNNTYSQYSLLHEFKRIAYLRDWASSRNIAFTNISSSPSIREINIKDNNYSLVLDEEYKFTYTYKDAPSISNDFGVSLLHTVDLKKIGNSFVIQKDYYVDCFQEGLDDYNFTLDETDLPISKYKTYNVSIDRSDLLFEENEKYDRTSAVNYANKYCGISWVDNSHSKYNHDYYSYTAACGNCTNFISQCLSDYEEGGKLKQDKSWLYKNNNPDSPQATPTWVSADDFSDYLLTHNRGTLVAQGNFEELISKSTNLQEGDLITYNINGIIEHTAIITGFDSNGYPLVNANSVDKYKVPFDLGWSNYDITFDFISVTE
ncbi:amidase domain-containing protein [Clostridium sp.]|uniref:amidase domain-containing protein n=1 Tax=Clostridium sp. TaxID=1506 RepID=UPI003F2F79AE